jgi:hypothetical protein
MKLLVDYDDQYLVQHVDNPLFIMADERVFSGGDITSTPGLSKKMPPQMMRLIGILEDKFLGRWVYVKEYREVLREIDFSVKNTLKQQIFKLPKHQRAELYERWNQAHMEFTVATNDTPGLWGTTDDPTPKVSYAPNPKYISAASDTGPSAYALFRRRRSVLIRAGVLRVKRAVKRRLAELLGRPLLPCECLVRGRKRSLLEAQVTTMVTQGALGGMITELDFLGDPTLALAVRHDREQFSEVTKKYELRVISDFDNRFRESVEVED